VYDGTTAHNKESDPTLPVNLYGRTKLEAEEEIAKGWGNYAILRSSLIVGPPACYGAAQDAPSHCECL